MSLDCSYRVHRQLLKIVRIVSVWNKMAFSVVELFVINYFMFKFLIDMLCKRVSTERSRRRLKLEHARITRHHYFLRRRMLHWSNSYSSIAQVE